MALSLWVINHMFNTKTNRIMRKSFSDLFIVQNGMISPKVPVNINGVIISPGVGISAGGGVLMGGVDLSKLVGKTLDVENDGGVYVIKGYYEY